MMAHLMHKELLFQSVFWEGGGARIGAGKSRVQQLVPVYLLFVLIAWYKISLLYMYYFFYWGRRGRKGGEAQEWLEGKAGCSGQSVSFHFLSQSLDKKVCHYYIQIVIFSSVKGESDCLFFAICF